MADYTGLVFTLDEIRQKIENLIEPASTVFFFLAGSPASGGPLGRGAGVIELNPNFPGKGQKKYNMYVVSVAADGTLAARKSPLWKSNSPEEIATWVKDRNKSPEELLQIGRKGR